MAHDCAEEICEMSDDGDVEKEEEKAEPGVGEDEEDTAADDKDDHVGQGGNSINIFDPWEIFCPQF